MWIIKNCYIMDPDSGKEGPGDIVIEGEIIDKLIFYSEHPGGYGDMCRRTPEKVLDADGAVAAPGLVDIHTHFREPGFTHKEDIESAAGAAIRGGYTTLVGMANTFPVADTPEVVRYILEKGKKTGIHIETCAAVTVGLEGKELTDMEALKAAGAVGFTDDGKPIMNVEILRQAMEKAAELGVPLSFHEEDPAFVAEAGVNGDWENEEIVTGAKKLGLRGADPRAEISMVERDVTLAAETGAVIDIQHISTASAAELVKEARGKGHSNIHAEATPHHFTLTEEAVEKYGTLAKMNPPLRRAADREAIRRGVADGSIDIIATDHAPHSDEEKSREFTQAPSGITGLETALSLGITELVHRDGMPLMELIQRLTIAPAKLYGLDAGYLAEGGPGDIVIFEPDEDYTVGGFASKSSNSPFLGWVLKGVVKHVICGGILLEMPDIRRGK